MIEIPGKNHVMHRETARVILMDREGCFLLLNTHYDARLQLPPRWITPGGAIDPGESVVDAAVRELLEETGMSISVDELGEQFAEQPERGSGATGRITTRTLTTFSSLRWIDSTSTQPVGPQRNVTTLLNTAGGTLPSSEKPAQQWGHPNCSTCLSVQGGGSQVSMLSDNTHYVRLR
jgi:ADP-ribose pyrophosphatase YjhB (NUDIX family)